MPRLTQTTTIDDTQYRVTPVGADTGSLFLFRVSRAGAGLLAGLKVTGGVVDFDVSGGIVQAMQALTPADFQWAMGVLKESTSVGIVDTKGDGRTTWVPLAQVYDAHFATNYSALLQWTRFAVEANGFTGFFVGIVALLRARKAPSPSASPPAVDGSAGVSSSSPA